MIRFKLNWERIQESNIIFYGLFLLFISCASNNYRSSDLAIDSEMLMGDWKINCLTANENYHYDFVKFNTDSTLKVFYWNGDSINTSFWKIDDDYLEYSFESVMAKAKIIEIKKDSIMLLNFFGCNDCQLIKE